jgi:hypothetical protein
VNEEAMPNTRDPVPLTAGNLRIQVGWLLVVLVATCGLILGLYDVGLWLVFASGSLATFAILALVRPGQEVASSSYMRHAETGWSYLRTELARARRHDRRFAIVGIPEGLWAPGVADGDEKANRGLLVAATVQTLVRRPDRAWVDGRRLHVLLTDCDRQKGLAFLERARASMPQLFSDDRVRLAVFPDDGITSGALLSALEPAEAPAIEPEPTGGVPAR